MANSKRTKNEREALAAQINEADQLKFSELLYKEYKKLYGVKKSFYGFLLNVLPNYAQEQLFNQIKIKIGDPKDKNSMRRYHIRDATNKDKADYLYRIRNNYTHSMYGPIPRIKNLDKSWRVAEFITLKNESLLITISNDFEGVLKNSILLGIAQIIKSKTN